MHETITLLLVTLPNFHRFKKKFTHRLSNKPYLIWLLTTPPHVKYVATLPCNLSLMACFADINVSLISLMFDFSALTLLVGRQEGHPACKKLSGGVLAWLSVWSDVQIRIWPS